MVVFITSDESHTLGDLIFTASPRAGEFVTKKIEGVEHNYRVKAVVHTPTTTKRHVVSFMSKTSAIMQNCTHTCGHWATRGKTERRVELKLRRR